MNSILTWPHRQDVGLYKPSPKVIGVATQIADELLARVGGRRLQEEMYYLAERQQHNLGSSLVSTIWEMGGAATVSLRSHTYYDLPTFMTRWMMEAHVDPATHEICRFVVPHYIAFPADWWCEYCGTLNNGLTYPRKCEGCQGPRPRNT